MRSVSSVVRGKRSPTRKPTATEPTASPTGLSLSRLPISPARSRKASTINLGSDIGARTFRHGVLEHARKRETRERADRKRSPRLLAREPSGIFEHRARVRILKVVADAARPSCEPSRDAGAQALPTIFEVDTGRLKRV